MGCLNNKRTVTSCKIWISVDMVERYKDVVARGDADSVEYCEAKIALEHAIPEWLARKAWSLAKEIQFMQQIIDATGHTDSALASVNRNLKSLEQ